MTLYFVTVLQGYFWNLLAVSYAEMLLFDRNILFKDVGAEDLKVENCEILVLELLH